MCADVHATLVVSQVISNVTIYGQAIIVYIISNNKGLIVTHM